jgi:sulfite exporter TauE/SafE
MIDCAELVAVFVAGALGSSHCLGMCGPIALALGASRRGFSDNLLRQCLFSAGRVATYSALGAMAGFAGWKLARQLPASVPVQAILAIVAGLLLVGQGLAATGWLPLPQRWAARLPCAAAPLVRNYLASPGWSSAVLAGALTGLLPCGLVYAFLALACSSQQMLDGGLRMAAFGLGTVPLMVGAGCAGSLLNLAARRHVLRVAGCCVILAGILSLSRGFGFLEALAAAADAGCPRCH